jgi:hypothetical protein
MSKKNPIIKFINTLPKMVGVFPEPEPAEKMLPEWYRKTESYYNNDKTPYGGTQRSTIKKCMAIFDILTAGYFLKAPCDIYIDTTEGKQIIEVPDFPKTIGIVPMVGNHDLKQLEKYPIDTDIYIEYVFRLNPVWIVSTQKGYSSMFVQPQHYSNSPLMAISAIIDTDNYASEGLLSFLVKKDFKGFIKKGEPIIQIMPFKRDNFSSEILSTQEDANLVKGKRGILRTVFSSGYKNSLWVRKSYK